MEEASFPALPSGMQQLHVLRLLEDIAHLFRIDARRMRTIRRMIEGTSLESWTSSHCEPVFAAKQSKAAQAFNISAKALRETEVFLESIGLAERRTWANGRRGGTFGVVFTPLITRIAELQALQEKRKQEIQQIETLVQKRSYLLKLTKKALLKVDSQDPAHHGFNADFENWIPSRYLRRLGLDQLIMHVDNCRKLLSTIEEHLQNTEHSCAPTHVNVRSYIQENNTNDSVICTAMPQNSETANAVTEPPSGVACATQCLGNDKRGYSSRKRHYADQLTPDKLCNLASDDMQSLIYAEKQKDGLEKLCWHHVIDAAFSYSAQLGVNITAWKAASHKFGPEIAATWVIILDSRRDDPVSPVQSVGAMLRDYTRRAERRGLNIFGTIDRLARRKGVWLS